jgi:RHS repeat-associated protein
LTLATFLRTFCFTHFPHSYFKRVVHTNKLVGSASQSWKQTFTYDRYGNRRFDFLGGNTTTPNPSCTEAICNPKISASDNRLISSGYAFDSAGNTTADAQGRAFVYDSENKQTLVSDGSGTIGEYFYDGDGKRVKKVVPSTGEETIFVYDAAGKLVAEYSTVVALPEDAIVAYLTNDHLGSPRINTDSNGNVTARHDYHPFGEGVGTSQRSSGLGYADDTVRKQFTAYERDNETNLEFAQARMYAKEIGRFTTVDPLASRSLLGNPQSLNRYSYTLNSPLTFTDPLGLTPWNPGDDRPDVKGPWQDKKDPIQCRCISADPSTHIDKNGRVIMVFNDGDNGVYQHGDNADGKAPTAAQIDKRHRKKGTSAGGNKIGDTQYWDEFVSPDTGQVLTDHTILVGTDMTSHIEAINKQATEEMNLYQMQQNSRNGGTLDIKAKWGKYGILLNGLYVTTRSAGNYLAGLNAATGTLAGQQIDFETFQKMAGAAQVFRQQGKPLTGRNLADIYWNGTAYGPAPAYGELEYQRRMSIEGFMRGRNR